VAAEVDASVWRRHAALPADGYNDDGPYKALLAEAVDAKAWALAKTALYAAALLPPPPAPAGGDPAALARILAAPARRFADPRVAWELRTGYADFPWADVMERRARVDLGAWAPAGADAGRLGLVRDALASDGNLRAALVRGHEVPLGEGVRTRALDLRGSAAARAAPGAVAFLVSALDRLESLDLRCERPRVRIPAARRLPVA
jgi:hypothetical protein